MSASPLDPAPGGDAISDIETRLLEAALSVAPFTGWNGGLLEAAAREAGVAPAEAVLLMPEGARDLAALFFMKHDRLALATLEATPPPAKVRERIRTAVLVRVESAMADAAAVRACTAYLALPQHAALAARLTWGAADLLWRWAGDTAADENHYTKRALLSGVLVSTVAAWLTGGRERAEAVLDRRLADIMSFERWKGGLPSPSGWAHAAALALGGLRYGRDPAPDPAPAEPARLTYEGGAAG